MDLEELQEYLTQRLPEIDIVSLESKSNTMPTLIITYKLLNINLRVPLANTKELILINVEAILETEIRKMIRYHELATESLKEILFKIKE